MGLYIETIFFFVCSKLEISLTAPVSLNTIPVPVFAVGLAFRSAEWAKLQPLVLVVIKSSEARPAGRGFTIQFKRWAPLH